MDRLLRQIDDLLTRQDRVIVAIDGPCASGKTTLAARLAQHYGCCVLHMDDFFLRPEQRTEDRLSQPGGNIDYARFRQEVLLPLLEGKPFTYRPYDCGTCRLSEPVQVVPAKLTVIEGSYSHHPYFQNPYDLKVFLTVAPELQENRILKRPAFLRQRFFEEWIPMENRYFEYFSIPENADLILDTASEE